MSSPAPYNFVESAGNACIVGVTFRTVLQLFTDEDGQDLEDLTGLYARVRISDSSGTIWEGDTDTGDVSIELVTSKVTLVLTPAITETFKVGDYHIDFDLVDDLDDPTDVTRFSHGDFQVIK